MALSWDASSLGTPSAHKTVLCTEGLGEKSRVLLRVAREETHTATGQEANPKTEMRKRLLCGVKFFRPKVPKDSRHTSAKSARPDTHWCDKCSKCSKTPRDTAHSISTHTPTLS